MRIDDDTVVECWRRVFDIVYGEPRDHRSRADFRGWDDSLTGERLPPEDLDEWLSHTVERIRELKPRRVLEIGAGTGNVCIALAPSVEYYVASDVSHVALRELAVRLEAAGSGGTVRLRHEDAKQALGSHTGTDSFDTIVLNSVVQYFPHEEYLAEVLRRACELVGDDGRVFLGDVRRDPPVSVRPDARADRAELTVAPSFFFDIATELGIAAVPLLKPGRARNELTAWRYDVVLAPARPPGSAARTLAWSSNCDLAPEVAWRLALRDPVCLTDVPNARTRTAVTGGTTSGVEPDDWPLGCAGTAVRAYPVWDRSQSLETYSVVLVREDARQVFDPTGCVRRTLSDLKPLLPEGA